jgi:AcrR family transcriptional regulator
LGITERRKREREDIRKKILNAARELFAAQVYEAVTMRKIAEKIEYSPTAIYFHFKDKETLIRELCTADALTLARLFQRIARVRDPIERLKGIGRAYADFALKHPQHYRVMFMTPHPPIDPKEVEIEKGNPEVDAYAFLKAAIQEAIQAGSVRSGLTDPELLAQTVWAGIHGVVSLHIAKSDDPWVDWRPIRKRVDLIMDLMMLGLTNLARHHDLERENRRDLGTP